MSAPIGLFAYNRPEHLARAMRALATCPELASSPLTIFCDGPKLNADRAKLDETRRIARELAPPHAQIIERAENLGLRKSMTAGVTALCEQHGRAIILEDDLEVSPTFLAFMNQALDRYEGESAAMQVSGYMYPVDVAGTDDATWLPTTSCWGWGVWERSWKQFGKGAPWFERLGGDAAMRRRFDLDDNYPYFDMLSAQRRGEIDSWGIDWYLDVFAVDGLCLYPRHSLVANRGHDGSGAHREQSSPFEADAHVFTCRRWPEVRLEPALYKKVCDFIGHAHRGGLKTRVGRLLGRLKGALG